MFTTYREAEIGLELAGEALRRPVSNYGGA